MHPPELSTADLGLLAERGISRAEAEQQLETLRNPPSPPKIVRPCVLGDGIHTLAAERHDSLTECWQRAVDHRRVSKFVPASGAATRMFAELAEPTTTAAEKLATQLASFAFSEALAQAVETVQLGDPKALAQALVSARGLGYGSLPKALIAFHSYADGPRTAFAEQLYEAVRYISSETNRQLPVHFTISPHHQNLFEHHLEAVGGAIEAAASVRLEVTFSSQDPATDTLCIEDDGAPFRESDGELLLRPAGHGALLGNLEATGGDIVVVKNIDNILPEYRQPEAVLWKRLLIGYAVETEEALAAIQRQLTSGELDAATAARELAAILGLEAPATEIDSWLASRLERPLRICGMVRNEGEPGGGPFWVADEQGVLSPQIVESAQIDCDDPEQERAREAATHFNPVDLVCLLRDPHGTAHQLGPFVDPRTAFISAKSHDGRALTALELPGLWNGAMAGWNTIFVEVPATTFAPVKTVFDLLRPEHQPATV